MTKEALAFVMHYLGNHELELDDLISGRRKTNRSLHIAIIKDGLAGVRHAIFVLGAYWDDDTVKKLKELEAALLLVEAIEKNKPRRVLPLAMLQVSLG